MRNKIAIVFFMCFAYLLVMTDYEIPEEPEEVTEVFIEVTELEEIELEEIEEPEEVYIGVLTPCDLSVEELERGLRKDLSEYAEVFLEMEDETGVSAVFLASVSALESGWGTSELSRGRNNLFGWAYSDGYARFDSKEECIRTVCRKIKELYLSEDGKYFSGYEVRDVNEKYCTSNEWTWKVEKIMFDIEKRAKGEVK